MSILEALEDGDDKAKKYPGVVPGIVTNNKDTGGMGRIKLKFPWLSDSNETDWVRLSTPMAGDGQGYYSIPDVGEEVLVAFEHGDINHPYVVGSLWNGKAKPPETNGDGKNNVRKFRSRSGHEIIFNDDGSGKKESLKIHTKAGHTILLDDSAGGEKIEITDKTGSNKIAIDSVGNSLSIESQMQLKIKSQTVEIEGTGKLSLKSSGILEINGSLVKIN